MYLIFSFNIGGIERLLIDLSNEMDNRKENVSICIINDDYTNSILYNLHSSIEIIKLNRQIGSANSFPYMYKLAQIVNAKHIDIIHCQGINCVFFAAIAKIMNPSTVIINTVHDSGNYSSYPYWKIFLQNRLCDHTIAISNSVRAEILQRRIRPDRVTTIYNAINTAKFQIASIPYKDHHQDREIKIGNVARFFPSKKGQDTLVYAVERLKNMGYHIHCFFAGAVFKGQEEPFQNLNKYIISHHLEDNVSFLGNVDDIPDLLQTLDIFILPSNYEGFGISLVEAMAMGLPCIASRLQGPEEIFLLAEKDPLMTNQPLGSLFIAGNSIDLANKIREVIDHLDDYDASAISDYAKRHFSAHQMADEHLLLYHHLTS